MFWNDTITIHCYTFDKTIYELYKPAIASNFIPNQWKELPKTYKKKVFEYNPISNMTIDVPTARVCDGIINMMSRGIIIPSWSDIKIECSSGQVLCHSPCGLGIVESHSREQVWDDLYPGYSQVKLISPWLFKTQEDIKFVWTRCDWHNTEQYKNAEIMSGVLDFKYQHASHVQMFVDGELNISAGDPLVQMFPLTEKKIKLKYHLIENQDYQNILGTKVVKYVGNYKERKKILGNKSKCPFGFGDK